MSANYDDIKQAVLDAIFPLPCVIPSYTDRRELDHEKERATKLRQWVATADLDPLVRRAYVEWLDYCDFQNTEGEKELVLKTRERRMAEYDAEKKAQAERVAKIIVPKPPRTGGA